MNEGTLLKLVNLTVTYGRVRAVNGVSLSVPRGSVRIILGANGAGKSSIVRAIMGLVKPASGQIEFPEGNNIVALPPHMVNALGIAWVPEGREVFATLTVSENLRLGAFRRGKSNAEDRTKYVHHLFPVLQKRSNQLAGSLSGGEQQMLAFGRALMSEPILLLMDEPSLGLAPKVVDVVFEGIAEVRRSGVSVLMAEQNARQALRIADFAYVLENGVISAEGEANVLAEREDVRRAYLGV